MTPSRSALIRSVCIGALLGAFVGLALDVLGVPGALKVGDLLLPCVIIGAVVCVSPLRPVLWWGSGVLAILLIIVAYTPIAPWLARSLVRSDAAPQRPLAAVFVLSGGITTQGLMQSETLSRLAAGAEAIHQKVADTLIVSREYAKRGTGAMSDSADQESFLAAISERPSVFYVDSATSTRDEAIRLSRASAAHQWSSIGIVTSPLHTRRACATFEQLGFRVTCLASAARDFSLGGPSSPGERMKMFSGWVYEMAATLQYKHRGWIR